MATVTHPEIPVTDHHATLDEQSLYFEDDLSRMLSARFLLDQGVSLAAAFAAAGDCPEFRPVAEAMAVLEASR